jgi:hypothetical protein
MTGARLDTLNIGLMLLSFGVALWLPFELFLFVYAVLGPAHYLTEISWLHERKYFTRQRRDFVPLVVLALLATVVYLSFTLPVLAPIKPRASTLYSTLIYVAFVAALLMVVVREASYRLPLAALLLAPVLLAQSYVAWFTFFIPTLVHVYLFTGCFMLYGALRSRSTMGLLSVVVFVACPIALVLLRPAGQVADSTIASAYGAFEVVNATILHLVQPAAKASAADVHAQVYASTAGIVVMRFIAFAYTYHYLNWFSKTSVIQWHQIPRRRLVLLGLIWIASVALYAVDYALGLRWLFFLSLAHVFLEFPLNHLTFLNIGRELRGRLGMARTGS